VEINAGGTTSGAATGHVAGRPQPFGDGGTRAAIFAAARELFASEGYAGASLRAIAARAGVDTALIRYFFGSKDDLFVAMLQIPDEFPERLVRAVAGDPDGVGERVVRTYLHLWEDPATAEPVLAIIRSAVASRDGIERVRELLGARLARYALPAVRGDRPELRATLASWHLMGIALARYVVRIDPLASMADEDLVALIAPTIQRYLTDPLPAARAPTQVAQPGGPEPVG